MIFRRRRHEAEQSQSRIQDAEAIDAAAKAQNRDALWLAEQSRAVTERLRREVEKNGWTELLQHAWGAR